MYLQINQYKRSTECQGNSIKLILPQKNNIKLIQELLMMYILLKRSSICWFNILDRISIMNDERLCPMTQQTDCWCISALIYVCIRPSKNRQVYVLAHLPWIHEHEPGLISTTKIFLKHLGLILQNLIFKRNINYYNVKEKIWFEVGGMSEMHGHTSR